MEIIKYPNPKLREISQEVKLPLSAEDRKLLDDMYTWLKENSGAAVGLSAIQVGIPKRMCAIRIRDVNGTISLKLVNPKIVKHSNKQTFAPEGCLSVSEEHDEKIPRW